MRQQQPWSERPPATCGEGGRSGCGEPIRWVTWPSKKRMPVDAEPDPTGRIAVDEDGGARYVSSGYEGPRYVSHFATCSSAGNFRRGGSQ